MKLRILSAALAAGIAASFSVFAEAQQASDDGFQTRQTDAVFDRLPLFGQTTPKIGDAESEMRDEAEPESLNRQSVGAATEARVQLAAQIRQQRALYHLRHQMARKERNAWIGHNPLRPHVAGNPMTTGRYEHPRLVIVPSYVMPR